MTRQVCLVFFVTVGLLLFQSVASLESCDLLLTTQCNCTFDQSLTAYNISCTYGGNPQGPILKNTSEQDQPIKVHHLDLSSNQITEVPSDYFSGILSIVMLNFANNSLANIPVAIETLSSTAMLRLEDNNITVFNISRLRRFSEMQLVDLSHNHISQLTGRLEGSISLEIHRLILAFNRIDTLDLPILSYLSEVHSLDLTHNALKTLGNFPTMKMRHLNLSLNALEMITNGVFENVQELQELILSKNSFTTIQGSWFKGLKNLRLLDLAGNEIYSLGASVVVNTPSLYSLDLRENHLSTLGNQEFGVNGHGLKQLNLNSNNISMIGEEAFGELNHLTSLFLAGNPHLTSLYRVRLPPHLTFLDLTNCGITELYKCDIIDLVDLKFLHLQGNNLSCDCHMTWLHQWQETAIDSDLRIGTETHKPWMCKKGDQLIPFHEFPRENFTCESPLHEDQFCPPEVSTLEPENGTVSRYSGNMSVPTSEDINLVLEALTSDGQIIARWTVTPIHHIYGFKVIFMGSEEGTKMSPWIHGSQREYALTDVQSYVQYNICVTAYHNESVVTAVSCATMETVSLKVYVGILAGMVAIVPCFIALAIVLWKDKRARKYEHLQSHEEHTDSHHGSKTGSTFEAANRLVVPADKTKPPGEPMVLAGPSHMAKKEKPIDVHPKEIESYINQSFAFTDEEPYRQSGKSSRAPNIPDKCSMSDQSGPHSYDPSPPPPISADVQCCDQDHDEFSTKL